jgi:hypothetical protein
MSDGLMFPPIRLEYVATAEIELEAPIEVGDVLLGRRRSIGIVRGTIRGPLLDATVNSGGADWQLIAADGTAIIDTRYTAVTTDGDVFSITTSGFRHGPPEVLARLAAGDDVDPGEYVFRVSARLESGAPALDWVNRTVFVATAGRKAAAVGYDLYAVR